MDRFIKKDKFISENNLTKNIGIAFLLSLIVGIIPLIIEQVFISKNNQYFILALLIIPFFSFFNLFFLLVIHYTKISRKILFDFRFLLIEIVLYYVFYYGITELLDKIPYKYAFIVTPREVSRKFYLMTPYDFIYTFVFLTLIIIVFRKAIDKNKNNT